jgi:PPOX class probable F420-dependent enzyme
LTPVDLSAFEAVGAQDHYLAVVATSRADGTVQASVVNAGVVEHPVSGEPVVAFVTYGPTKLANLRRIPRATIVFRAGWQWAAVEGPCAIAGPDDVLDGFDPAGVPELLRAVFRAAGGTHDDWDEYDRVMREDRRAAVLVTPARLYSNAGS